MKEKKYFYLFEICSSLCDILLVYLYYMSYIKNNNRLYGHENCNNLREKKIKWVFLRKV